ncbi:M2 family metallopeptidase [bacterium]|nr:M2 family metallopeptidase [bacterium]
MKTIYAGLVFCLAGMFSCAPNPEEKALEQFIDSHTQKIMPLMKEANLTYWNAALGDTALFEKFSILDLKIRKIYSDTADYGFLKRLKKSGHVSDPLLTRQLDVLMGKYLENQVAPELLEQIVTLGARVEKNFNMFRSVINKEEVTVNRINELLKTETENKKRKQAWLASKQVGPAVAGDIIQLVKLRNEAARKLGFDNYHTLMLTVNEQDVGTINQVFDELYGLTYKPFEIMKSELDSILAAMYGVDRKDLMPWHYHDSFFQETPLVYHIDLDAYYGNQDIEALAAKFYEGIGLSVQDILDRSDLYEKENKNPHAFCTDIDREGDIRILCNIKPTERWMETMLHELGHAVYDKYQNPATPFLLREPANIFTTEAVAMLFGRLSRDGAWMQAMLGLTDQQRGQIDSVSEKYARMKQLIFARWAMVMFKFEQELYKDPDQDLNSLWWELKSKYQLLNRPGKRDAPDWASKIHFTIAPCYYHNYLLGELLASQLHHQIISGVLKEGAGPDRVYAGRSEVGDFLVSRVFRAGRTLPWNDMIRSATGEPLNPKYFVDQFVN